MEPVRTSSWDLRFFSLGITEPLAQLASVEKLCLTCMTWARLSMYSPAMACCLATTVVSALGLDTLRWCEARTIFMLLDEYLTVRGLGFFL